jgi:hypothetical protein
LRVRCGPRRHYDGDADRIHVIATVEDAERVSVANPHAVAYATQTTLALDAVAPTIAVLKHRFPKCTVPEALVSRVLERLRQWWPDLVIDSIGKPESVQFRLPRQLMVAPADASRATEAAALAH